MAEDKKSFVLYSDLIKSIDHLTNEEKGILFNHLLGYVNDKNPILTDRLILTAWKPIELQLKRDLIKFEEVKVKRSEAGKKSAELRALKIEQNPTNSTSVESVQQTSTNPTVNDNVNVNVNDNVNDINKHIVESIDFDVLLSYINKSFGRSFQTINKATRQKYLARFKESYNKHHVRNAIDNCVKDKYHVENNYKYCTPEYFSRANTLDLHSAFTESVQEVYKSQEDIYAENVIKQIQIAKSFES